MRGPIRQSPVGGLEGGGAFYLSAQKRGERFAEPPACKRRRQVGAAPVGLGMLSVWLFVC